MTIHSRLTLPVEYTEGSATYTLFFMHCIVYSKFLT